MDQINRYSRGIVSDRNRLYWEDFKRMPSPTPPSVEQAAIVCFLNYANRRINTYVRAKRKLVTLLEEQKQAVVHRAVTRGLNPGARFKSSRIAWVGDIPEQWEVRELGQIAVSFRTGPFGSSLHQSDYVEGGIPLVNPTHMRRGRIIEDQRCTVSTNVVRRLSSYQLDKHDLVFARRGELGRCALVRDREAGWLCGTGSIRVRVDYTAIDPEDLIETLQLGGISEFLSLFSVGATMESLNTGILKRIPVVLPPLEEQREILKRIRNDFAIADLATSQALREIGLLREYHARLVHEVITGKVDVRDAAAAVPADRVEASQRPEESELSDAGYATRDDFDDAVQPTET
jgi:type I restriction enzyme, S subunit